MQAEYTCLYGHVFPDNQQATFTSTCVAKENQYGFLEATWDGPVQGCQGMGSKVSENGLFFAFL